VSMIFRTESIIDYKFYLKFLNWEHLTELISLQKRK